MPGKNLDGKRWKKLTNLAKILIKSIGHNFRQKSGQNIW